MREKNTNLVNAVIILVDAKRYKLCLGKVLKRSKKKITGSTFFLRGGVVWKIGVFFNLVTILFAILKHFSLVLDKVFSQFQVFGHIIHFWGDNKNS